MYTKKIQVSRGILHGIALESDRWCLTCRNGQITENVQKIEVDFSRGYQAFFSRNWSHFRRLVNYTLRQSSTFRNSGLPKMFDFSEVTEDFSFAELVEFPRVVFFGSTRFFRITRTFAGYRSRLFYLSN